LHTISLDDFIKAAD
jgi:EF-hand domain pair